MCNAWCLEFVKKAAHFVPENASILEVGSKDVNGTARHYLPHSNYFGVDLSVGRNVDEVMNVYDIGRRFGDDSFDVVVSTELLEHVEDWAEAVYQIILVCKPGGYIYITTRSEGFPFHEYPIDAWRFSLEDVMNIFSPIGSVVAAEKDPSEGSPGVGIVVRKSSISSDKLLAWKNSLYREYELFHVKADRRVTIASVYPKPRS